MKGSWKVLGFLQGFLKGAFRGCVKGSLRDSFCFWQAFLICLLLFLGLVIVVFAEILTVLTGMLVLPLHRATGA